MVLELIKMNFIACVVLETLIYHCSRKSSSSEAFRALKRQSASLPAGGVRAWGLCGRSDGMSRHLHIF
jgi:hypothetical protein